MFTKNQALIFKETQKQIADNLNDLKLRLEAVLGNTNNKDMFSDIETTISTAIEDSKNEYRKLFSSIVSNIDETSLIDLKKKKAKKMGYI